MKISRETPLIKSQFLQTVENNSEAIIWHSLFGRPKIVSVQMLEFIRIFAIPQTLNLVYEEYEFDNNEMAYLKEMIVDYFLIPKGFDERSLLSKRMQKREQTITNGSLINYLSLIVSEGCNFRCAYCIHFNNLETSHRIKNSKKFMQFEIAKDAIDRYMGILRQHGKKVAEVNFGGGEPLLAWPVINLILEYCQLTYGKEFLFNFSINTNASLITAKIAKKLKEYNVRTALSIDGLSDGNDKVRLTKAGGKTFNIIVKGFENLMAQYHSLNGITITVNEHNFPYLSEKIIDWAAKWQMREVRIDIDVIGMVAMPIGGIVKTLMRMRRYARKYGITVFGFWSRPVENLNDSPLDSHVAFCGAVRGNSICISPSGDIYSCGYSIEKLGTLDQMDSFYKTGEKYHRFINTHTIGAKEMCRGCIIEGQCGGGCNITQEFSRAAKTLKVDRMCDFYRAMTKELLLEQLHEVNS